MYASLSPGMSVGDRLSSSPSASRLFGVSSQGERGTSSLQACLGYQAVGDKCSALEMYLGGLSTKEEFRPFYEYFPQLLVSVFGFDGKSGWINTASSVPDRDALRRLFSPTGVLFDVMLKLRLDSKLNYEFPCSKLPPPTQRLLAESEFNSLPSHYNYFGKLRFNADGKVPVVIILDMLEYFFYCFAYFLNFSTSSSAFTRTTQSPTSEGRGLRREVGGGYSLYENLLQDFLDYFLPLRNSFQSKESNRQFSPLSTTREHVRSRKFNSFIPAVPSVSPAASLGLPAGGESNNGEWMERQGFSEVFLNILIEFWLNQNSYDQLIVCAGDPSGHSAALLDYLSPTLNLLGSLKLLVRHLHRYFYTVDSLPGDTTGLNSGLMGSVQLSSGSPFRKDDTASLTGGSFQEKEILRRNVWQFFQTKFYRFLRLTVILLPMDASIESVVDLWLVSMSPWQSCRRMEMGSRSEVTSIQSGVASDEELVLENWTLFIYENVLLYSVLCEDILSRVLGFDWNVLDDVELAYRIGRFFEKGNLVEIIRKGVQCLNQVEGPVVPVSNRASIAKPMKPSTATISSIKSHAMAMECNRNSYAHSVFDKRPSALVRELVNSLREVKYSQTMQAKLKHQREESQTFAEFVFKLFETEPVMVESGNSSK